MAGMDDQQCAVRSYLLECYWPDVDREGVGARVARLRSAVAHLAGEGREIDLADSIFVPGDETLFCVVTGAEADVLEASREAGLPFDRIRESIRFD